VGAASSRDHLISRLEAAPTGFFYGNLDFLDKRQFLLIQEPERSDSILRYSAVHCLINLEPLNGYSKTMLH
jgi:hypothetical protein